MMKGLVECPDCRVWSDIPEKFKETLHFARCPKCLKSMFLIRSMEAKDLGFKEKDKVSATLMKIR